MVNINGVELSLDSNGKMFVTKKNLDNILNYVKSNIPDGVFGVFGSFALVAILGRDPHLTRATGDLDIYSLNPEILPIYAFEGKLRIGDDPNMYYINLGENCVEIFTPAAVEDNLQYGDFMNWILRNDVERYVDGFYYLKPEGFFLTKAIAYYSGDLHKDPRRHVSDIVYLTLDLGEPLENLSRKARDLVERAPVSERDKKEINYAIDQLKRAVEEALPHYPSALP